MDVWSCVCTCNWHVFPLKTMKKTGIIVHAFYFYASLVIYILFYPYYSVHIDLDLSILLFPYFWGILTSSQERIAIKKTVKCAFRGLEKKSFQLVISTTLEMKGYAQGVQTDMYVGWTSRTAYTRTRDHFNNYKAAAAAKIPAKVLSGTTVMCGKPRCLQQNKCKCDVKLWMWEHTHYPQTPQSVCGWEWWFDGVQK